MIIYLFVIGFFFFFFLFNDFVDKLTFLWGELCNKLCGTNIES